MEYVECFYILRGNCCTEVSIEPWFPGGTMDIIFDLGAPFEQGAVSGLMKKRPGAFVAGLFECGLRIKPTGDVHQIGVVFKPGRFRHFVKGSQMEYKGKVAPLSDVFGPIADDVVDQMQDMDEDAARINLVQSFLLRTLRPAVKSNHFIDYCIDVIRERPGTTSIADLGRSARISSRHFRRLFKDYVGISPKLFSMMMRLEVLIRQSRSNPLRLNQISYELGYYDPSHLSRDFKGISGMRAMDFLKRSDLIATTFITS